MNKQPESGSDYPGYDIPIVLLSILVVAILLLLGHLKGDVAYIQACLAVPFATMGLLIWVRLAQGD